MKPLQVFRWFMGAAIVALLPAMVQTTAAQNMRGKHDRMRMAPNFSNGPGSEHFDHRHDFAFRHQGGDRCFFHHDGGDRFFFRHQNPCFQQFAWPVYSYTYYNPFAYSYPVYGPGYDYQYSAAPVQTESFRPAADNNPVVIVTNTGNSRPTDSSSSIGYVNRGYSLTDAAWQQRKAVQDPNEKIGPPADSRTLVPPAVPEPTQTAKSKQTTPRVQAGVFGNLVLVSWLEDGGKDVIYVQNIETNDVQKITSRPNLDNFRLVELRPDADPKLFEAVISNGTQQGPVRFRF